MRLQKTATGTTGVTKYSLHGKNIVHLTNAKNNLHFFYDARNKPAVVTFNGTAYAYLYNLQGDVIALIDSNGKKVVEYKYDAWGRILSKTGTMASTLGTLNPFRYRGYVYDEETGLYYLRSRYYNPEWERFLNADVLLGSQSSLLHNVYAYCTNSPIVKIDENGCMGKYSLLSTFGTWIKNVATIVLHTEQVETSLDAKRPTITVSAFLNNLQYLVDKKIDVSNDTDTGCAMFIRAGILSKKGHHSHKTYYAGITPMFEKNMVFWGEISDIGGVSGLIPGRVLGEYQDKKKFVSHRGVYYGLYDFGNGLEPAVYSFDTVRKRGQLHPYSDNAWVFYGWHEGVILD